MTTPSPNHPPAYHHGDLRRALLDGASAILADTGRWDFSLREVARQAGVSHNAPYRHFADKEALLAAVAVEGYEALRQRTTQAAQGAQDAVAVLTAIGEAYIAFGAANPALYRLMLGQHSSSLDGLSPAVVEAANEARGVLREVILSGARTGLFTVDPEDGDDVTAAVIAAWSLVHGFTLLTIDRLVDREVEPQAIAGLATRVAERFIRGLTSGR